MKLVVIGAQWGDEGKGKIVDFLARGAGIVLRYGGGANAGHTVVVGGQTFKFHLIPSGIVYPQTVVVLGIGMVVDPAILFEELDELAGRGVSWQGRVLLSDRAHLVLPRYKELDRRLDQERRKPLGTTGRGIGVTYTLKAQRDGIRVVDIFDRAVWEDLGREDREFLQPLKDRIAGLLVDVSRFVSEHGESDILLEGAQGTLLDLDFGTYPFVSSGISSAAGAAVGAGIGPTAIDRALGVFKAYSTRVGNGPFPTEFTAERDGSLGETIREKGREYGVTTGRPRRCGYLDLVALRYACRSNSLDSLILTKLDIYDGLEEIKACTAYEVDGRRIDDFPASVASLAKARPVLHSLPGWKGSASPCRAYGDLPQEARNYIRFIEEAVGTPVSLVSVGCERAQTIVRKDPWTRS